MCGRFQLNNDLDDQTFIGRFNIINFKSSDLIKSKNIVPSQQVSVVVKHSPNSLTTMMWGLIPPWAQDKKQIIFNVRSETVFEKKMFQKLILTQRCLIPATGFYEWSKVNGQKIPHRIDLVEKKIFALAGIYDIWLDENKQQRQVCAILTTNANHQMMSIHDRMPVIMREEDEENWLNPDIVEKGELDNLFEPLPSRTLAIQEIKNIL